MICMVCYLMPPMYGGAGAQALRLAQELKKKGSDVTALTARFDGAHPRRESNEGVAIHRLGTPWLKPLRAFFFSLLVARELIRQRKNFEIVHIHGAYLRIIPIVFVARKLGLPCIVKMSMYGTDDPETIRRRRFGRLLLRSLASVDAVVSISSELTAAYRRSGLPPENFVEIPNGVDTGRFRPAAADDRARIRDRLGFPESARVAVFTGAVQRRKGVDILLAAWRLVCNNHSDALLVLVGPLDEMEEDARAELIRVLETSERTIAAGFRTDVEDYLRASDVFVLPTRMEGLSNAVIEAMACGLPSVASNIGGNTDLVDHGKTGFLFDVDDTEELARRIGELFDDTDMREQFGRRAREKAEADFSIEQTAKRYADLYNRLARS